MFDPYHQWLGIPKDRRPPTHYQLLGLAVKENDRAVIESAAVRQSAYVRNFQFGQYADHATTILNEIAEARTVLLDAEKRKAYDSSIAPPKPQKKPAPAKNEINWEKASSEDITGAPSGVEVEMPKPAPAPSRSTRYDRRSARTAGPGRKEQPSSVQLLQMLLGVAVVAALCFGIWIVVAPSHQDPKKKNENTQASTTDGKLKSGPSDGRSTDTSAPSQNSGGNAGLSDRAIQIKTEQEAFDAAVKELESLIPQLSEQSKTDSGLFTYADKIEEARPLREKEKIQALINTAKRLLAQEHETQINAGAAGNKNDSLSKLLSEIRTGDFTAQKSALERLMLAQIILERKDEVAEVLHRLLELGDTNKITVIKTLGYWGNEASADILCRICDEEQKGFTKEAMRSLAKLKLERGVESIKKRLWDKGDSDEAAKALKDIGAVAESHVWDLLKNKFWDVRGAGCEILGEIGTSESIAKIKPLLTDKDKRVQTAARNALNRINGRDSKKPESDPKE